MKSMYMSFKWYFGSWRGRIIFTTWLIAYTVRTMYLDHASFFAAFGRALFYGALSVLVGLLVVRIVEFIIDRKLWKLFE